MQRVEGTFNSLKIVPVRMCCHSTSACYHFQNKSWHNIDIYLTSLMCTDVSAALSQQLVQGNLRNPAHVGALLWLSTSSSGDVSEIFVLLPTVGSKDLINYFCKD